MAGPRNNIAAIDIGTEPTSSSDSWDPNADSSVLALAVSGGTIFAGGTFTSVGRQRRNSIAAINALTGLATSWNPDIPRDIFQVPSLAVSGETVYAGGSYTIDAVTGAVTPGIRPLTAQFMPLQ